MNNTLKTETEQCFLINQLPFSGNGPLPKICMKSIWIRVDQEPLSNLVYGPLYSEAVYCSMYGGNCQLSAVPPRPEGAGWPCAG